MTPPQSTAGQAGVSDDFVVFQGRPGRRLGELALPHRRRRQLVPQPGEFAVAAPVPPGPHCPGSGPLPSGAVHTREGTGKKRALSGGTSVATATTAVHATSENVTGIQLCIAALAGFPLRTVVPIGGSRARAATSDRYAARAAFRSVSDLPITSGRRQERRGAAAVCKRFSSVRPSGSLGTST